MTIHKVTAFGASKATYLYEAVQHLVRKSQVGKDVPIMSLLRQPPAPLIAKVRSWTTRLYIIICTYVKGRHFGSKEVPTFVPWFVSNTTDVSFVEPAFSHHRSISFCLCSECLTDSVREHQQSQSKPSQFLYDGVPISEGPRIQFIFKTDALVCKFVEFMIELLSIIDYFDKPEHGNKLSDVHVRSTTSIARFGSSSCSVTRIPLLIPAFQTLTQQSQ
jgi:hypothetical protein